MGNIRTCGACQRYELDDDIADLGSCSFYHENVYSEIVSAVVDTVTPCRRFIRNDKLNIKEISLDTLEVHNQNFG